MRKLQQFKYRNDEHTRTFVPDPAVCGHGNRSQDNHVRDHEVSGGELFGSSGSRQTRGGGAETETYLVRDQTEGAGEV